MNIENMSDDELEGLLQNIYREQQRRWNVDNIPKQIEHQVTKYLEATGETQGGPWKQPTGAHDAYPLGWVVTHEDKEWESTRTGNADEPAPGPSWKEIVPEGEPPAEWAPRHAHNAYMIGDRVTFEGAIYESLIDNNAWSPAAHAAGWKLV